MEKKFNETELREELNAFQLDQLVVFGLSCAERMIPNYKRFTRECRWGDPDILRNGLDLTWNWLTTGTISEKEVKKMLATCEAQTPDTDDFDTILVSSALDAANSVSAVLELILSNRCDSAIEIAIYGRDTVDMYIQESEGMDPQDAQLENKIWLHPLMQRELKSQRSAISLIKQGIAIKDAESIWKRHDVGSLGF
ncbi:uncharacterized protein YjaG (DUF416 family) [Prosthecobacter fusiformis]|uniref:Uncharacterized protein YjaG (DUF416 family) n=1 Tax=Prosthecobacter fusiformis TaxID=48464 RepID=A0A4R7RTB1_9BACT|nr:DUF416 family protein [Prosthecobacter fusiformis]TDU68056.1 uncharacterized protein YjaG (DUF416 family) [Prosthecobacter fusiformis]